MDLLLLMTKRDRIEYQLNPTVPTYLIGHCYPSMDLSEISTLVSGSDEYFVGPL